MARKARIHVPGGVYHVMMLGNGGQDIFFADHDRYRLYLLIQEGTVRFDYRVHAFCLMGNHIHLNPVRAGLVKQADYYPFSSHRSYLGYAPLPWLTTDWILRQFDRSVMKAPMVGKAYGLSVLELKAAGRSRQAAEARALVGLIVVQLSIDPDSGSVLFWAGRINFEHRHQTVDNKNPAGRCGIPTLFLHS